MTGYANVPQLRRGPDASKPSVLPEGVRWFADDSGTEYGGTGDGIEVMFSRSSAGGGLPNGSTVVPSGQVTVSVSHGMAVTPARVLLMPTGDTQLKRWWVSAADSNTFTITLDSAPSGDVAFDWVGVPSGSSSGGSMSVPSGSVVATVSHGLGRTPATVVLTPTSDTLLKRWWRSALGASSFDVRLDSAAGGPITFDWQAW